MTARSAALLSIDLDALEANYRDLIARLNGVPLAAVVKADAYGLGATHIGPALTRAGCRTFFVATLEEGIELRGALPEATIGVFHGVATGEEMEFQGRRLMPVLNDLEQIARWSRFGKAQGAQPALIHIDTGMTRLGLTESEIRQVADQPEQLDGIDLRYFMSHLACADEPEHPLNRAQLEAFRRLTALLPPCPRSLANSSGIFLGPEYHFDLARSGAALYGVNPTPYTANPMREVVRLSAPVIQLRDIDAPRPTGYGATFTVPEGSRIATVALGYADGLLRSLSNRMDAFVGEVRVPVVGRVSMDMLCLDVSQVASDAIRPGDMVEIMGPHQPADAVADRVGTIAYELFTRFGKRLHREYLRGGKRV